MANQYHVPGSQYSADVSIYLEADNRRIELAAFSQHRLLHVQAVFRLAENGLGVSLQHFVSDLLAPIRWQAVHDLDVIGRGGDQMRVHGEPREVLAPPLCLVLLAHTDPRVGVYNVCIRDGFDRIVRLGGTIRND